MLKNYYEFLDPKSACLLQDAHVVSRVARGEGSLVKQQEERGGTDDEQMGSLGCCRHSRNLCDDPGGWNVLLRIRRSACRNHRTVRSRRPRSSTRKGSLRLRWEERSWKPKRSSIWR